MRRAASQPLFTLVTFFSLFFPPAVHPEKAAPFAEADVDRYFSIRLGANVRDTESRLAEIRRGLLKLLNTYGLFLGEGAVRERLGGLARGHLFAGHGEKVPVYFFEDTHPHNFPPGFPYPLLVVSEIR